MNPIGWTKFQYLAYFANPKGDRAIFRAMKKKQITKIVEIGLRDTEFTTNLLRTALKYRGEKKITYAGVDLFEARPAQQDSISLKDTHRRLSCGQWKARLIPGDPMIGLSRFANTLSGTELLIISDDVDADAMKQAWYFVPRMLNDDSSVFVCSTYDGKVNTKSISLTDIESLANASTVQRRAA